MADTNKIVTGSAENKVASFVRSHKKLVLVAAVLLVVAVAVGASLLLNRDQEATTFTPKNDAEKILGREQTVGEQADLLNQQGKYDEAKKLIEDNAATADDAEKSKLYQSQALIALNSGKLPDAMAYAMRAEEADDTAQSATMVALVAERSGDKATAIKYYELTIERLGDPAKVPDPTMIPYYQDKIVGLQK